MEAVYDIAIIGGGIVGLSTAMQLAQRNPQLRIVVLEKEAQVAAHQTGHNSGVIHSGVYYKPGSLKAQLCVSGAARLVEFCREHGVPHEVCGKVIIATRPEELGALEELHRRGAANGVPGVERIAPGQLRELEPHAAGIAGLLVRSTGITDYTAVAAKYAELFLSAGGTLQLRAGVHGVRNRNAEIVLETARGAVTAQFAINCAGLHSDRLARLAGEQPSVRIVPFRGEYYEIAHERRHLVRGLIYPVPDPRLPFLGVHFTRRTNGSVEAGPNAVLAFKREGYGRTDIDLTDAVESLTSAAFWRMAARYWRAGIGEYWRSLRKPLFTRELQRLVPAIREQDLRPGGSGVRAQALDANGALVDDFRFVSGGRMIHVLNVPSPAATASLAIGEHIGEMAAREWRGWGMLAPSGR